MKTKFPDQPEWVKQEYLKAAVEKRIRKKKKKLENANLREAGQKQS